MKGLRINEITYGRKFNLGNYETEDFSFSVSIPEEKREDTEYIKGSISYVQALAKKSNKG